MLLTVRVRRTSWNPMKPRIQCVLAHWIPGSIASGRRPAGVRQVLVVLMGLVLPSAVAFRARATAPLGTCG